MQQDIAKRDWIGEVGTALIAAVLSGGAGIAFGLVGLVVYVGITSSTSSDVESQLTLWLSGIALLGCGVVGFAIGRMRGFRWAFAIGLLVPIVFIANTGLETARSDSLSEALTLVPQALCSVGLALGYVIAWRTKRSASGTTQTSAAPVEQRHRADGES